VYPSRELAGDAGQPNLRSVKGPRVLVIEDDFALSENLREILSDEGYAVGVARNGLEGLSAARLERPDVIALDLVMPVLDGWAFRTAQSADPSLAQVPVLVLSSTDDEVRPAAAGYFSKPFEVKGLLGAIHRLAPCPSAGQKSPHR